MRYSVHCWGIPSPTTLTLMEWFPNVNDMDGFSTVVEVDCGFH
ncbi:hypothetical protein SAMN02799624_05465 [Paenibacillus sp. UNC496MF]|nr:hypothetical protein SAMN02799624_05465 [Paenibacillus sp. UNC496MF]